MPYKFNPEGYIPPASEAPKVTMDMRPPEGYKPLEIEVPRATAMGFAQQNAEIPRSAVMAYPRPCMKDWTSSRNSFCKCRRNSRLSEDKIYLERMLQTSVWFQMLRFLI